MADNSHLTAITRKTLPRPTKYLKDKEKLIGNILDYGCGRCHELNNRYFKASGWDPHYRPVTLKNGSFDTIICNFVLNVISDADERQGVLDNIHDLLKPGGKAYITVRRDVHKAYVSKRGTFQGKIYLPYNIETQNNDYCMYVVTKEELN